MTELNKYLIHFNSTESDILSLPIYRVFSLEKFLTSLHENMLFLVKTKIWEDPFEAFLFKQLIWTDDGEENYPFGEEFTENFYGQCWTYLKESNLMWKAYAPNNDGIIVKSSIGKIIDLFIKNQDLSNGSTYFGNVIYQPQDDIKAYFENKETVEALLGNQAAQIMLETLFTKRIEFEQEKELRLIRFTTSFGKGIPISKIGFTLERVHLFNELADELILDPRIDPIRGDSIIRLIKKLGFSGNIEKSRLYDAPNFSLRINRNR